MDDEGFLPLSNEEKRRRKAADKSKNARERNKLKVIQMNFFLTLTDNDGTIDIGPIK